MWGINHSQSYDKHHILDDAAPCNIVCDKACFLTLRTETKLNKLVFTNVLKIARQWLDVL